MSRRRKGPLSSPGQAGDGDGARHGWVVVRGEQLSACAAFLELGLHGKKLANKDGEAGGRWRVTGEGV